MPANYTHTTRATGLTLTAAIYNEDHQNHINNMIPGVIDDYSVNVAQMQETVDPGEVGTENPAASLADELKQLRFCLKEIKGTTHWYQSLGTALASLGANTFTGLQRIVRAVAGNFLELESTEAGATSAPNIELYRNSASPAADDFGGNINWYWKDSGGNKQFGGQIYSRLRDPTNASEDTLIGVGTMRAGVQSDWAFESGTLRHISQSLPSVEGGLAVAALTIAGNPAGAVQAALYQDQKANGTDGGGSTSGSWQDRVLNTEVFDNVGSVLVSNAVSLAAGTYIFYGIGAFYTNEAALRILNSSDTVVIATGPKGDVGVSGTGYQCTVLGAATFATSKAVKLQYRTNASRATDGLGQATSWSGEVEVYASLLIVKLA